MVRVFRWRVNPRRRVLDDIRDAEVRGDIPWGQRLPRQRNGDGRPLEPPYTEGRYWGRARFRRPR